MPVIVLLSTRSFIIWISFKGSLFSDAPLMWSSKGISSLICKAEYLYFPLPKECRWTIWNSSKPEKWKHQAQNEFSELAGAESQRLKTLSFLLPDTPYFVCSSYRLNPLFPYLSMVGCLVAWFLYGSGKNRGIKTRSFSYPFNTTTSLNLVVRSDDDDDNNNNNNNINDSDNDNTIYSSLSSKMLKRTLIKWNITRLRIPTCKRQTKNSYFTGLARNGTRDNREWIQIQLANKTRLELGASGLQVQRFDRAAKLPLCYLLPLG